MSQKLTTEEFIKKARKVHGDRYDYSKVEYVNNQTKVCIICKEHGEFWQIPQKHLTGQGCIKCHREAMAKRYSLGKEKFIEKSNAVHNGFYDYSEVEYVNGHMKVKIICPIHGIFEQEPSSHLQGHGCPFCADVENGKKKRKWTYDSCYEEAKKHKSKIAFKIAAPTAYAKARTMGWLNEYTWFTSLRKDLGFWTKEQCFEEAKKYKSKTEFMEGCPTAYSKSLKNGWSIAYTWFTNEQINVYKGKVDSIYSYFFEKQNAVYVGRTLMKRQKDRDREHIYKVDRDAVAKYAKECDCPVPPMVIIEDNLTLEEGQERERFWIDEYKQQGYTILNKAATGKGTSSLGMIGHGKWNRKSCFKEAQKYKNATAFEKGSGGAYNAALTNGWLSEYTWFIKLWEPKWDKKACYEEAKKYKTRGEFQNGSTSAYNKALRKGWIDEYYWMPARMQKPVGYWNNYEKCFQEAKKYNSRFEFEKGNISAYQKALKNGWLDDYTWFKEMKKPNGYWNRETCYEEAKKYSSKKEFKQHVNGAYQFAYKEGWLNDYTWFKPLTGYWTYEACKAEAAKYEKRGQFKAAQPSAYTKSRKNGWIDEFFPKK